MNVSVRRSGRSSPGPPPTKRATSCRTAVAGRPNLSELPRPEAWQEEAPFIEIAEAETEYKIVVPLSGIDARKIHVFATPRSLLIEIRSKSNIRHELGDALVLENIDHRVSRELTLPVEIEQGGTHVQIHGESLHITALKSEWQEQPPWSQLIQFNTRAGLGLV